MSRLLREPNPDILRQQKYVSERLKAEAALERERAAAKQSGVTPPPTIPERGAPPAPAPLPSLSLPSVEAARRYFGLPPKK